MEVVVWSCMLGYWFGYWFGYWVFRILRGMHRNAEMSFTFFILLAWSARLACLACLAMPVLLASLVLLSLLAHCPAIPQYPVLFALGTVIL